MSKETANRLHLSIGKDEIQNAAGNTPELRNLKRMIKMFSELLPGLIMNDALFHIGVAAGQLTVLPRQR